MTTSNLSNDSIVTIIKFLKENIPGDGAGGWDHMFTTAYQIGCEALVALGQAVENGRGASPRNSPTLPEMLPRTDDLYVAVLYLADQLGLMNYLSEKPPGPEGQWRDSRLKDGPPLLSIHAADNPDGACADEQFHALLGQLGLIEDSVWTEWAEPILWRSKPDGWGEDFRDDPRFVSAVEYAIATMPDGIEAEMDRLVAITDAELANAVERAAIAHANFIKRYPNVRVGPKSVETVEHSRRAFEFTRRHDLDWIFFRRWRLDDGWLNADEAKRALDIFHDGLAIAMRNAVIARLYPDRPQFLDRERSETSDGPAST